METQKNDTGFMLKSETGEPVKQDSSSLFHGQNGVRSKKQENTITMITTTNDHIKSNLHDMFPASTYINSNTDVS